MVTTSRRLVIGEQGRLLLHLALNGLLRQISVVPLRLEG